MTKNNKTKKDLQREITSLRGEVNKLEAQNNELLRENKILKNGGMITGDYCSQCQHGYDAPSFGFVHIYGCLKNIQNVCVGFDRKQQENFKIESED